MPVDFYVEFAHAMVIATIMGLVIRSVRKDVIGSIFTVRDNK